ncbi:hypothetical protein DPMN_105800 [Dreissena polymorpha]|uniref:Uncharacterized protein n=1 Tax=Dreissena polymorpha TaxID=45954 RepID=A0A9D4K3U0_DREPO|nr:hypothetical protein DPMN_105800 [Dreissena polymorpha]
METILRVRIRNADPERGPGARTRMHGNPALGVCPRVVSLERVGMTARVHVCVFNISAKTIQIAPKAVLCKRRKCCATGHRIQGARQK